jgi:membrane protein implicated in regulation of membrane protease activity
MRGHAKNSLTFAKEYIAFAGWPGATLTILGSKLGPGPATAKVHTQAEEGKLPRSMHVGVIMAAWKLWIVLGLLLAVAELLVLPAQFLLVALGVCAILVGVLAWGTDLSYAAQLAWFAGLAIVLVPVFVYVWRRKAPIRYAGTAGESQSAPQQAEVIRADPLLIKLRGDEFPAEAPEGVVFSAGEKVTVRGFSGITAQIEKRG